MKRMRSLILLAGLMLLAPGASRAQSGYNIQNLVKDGDTIAGVKLGSFTDFQIVGLNDNGELVFYALDPTQKRVLFDYNGSQFTRIAGEGDTIGGVVLSAFQGGGDGPTINGQTTFLGFDPNGKDLLFQYAGGKTTLIAAPGMPAPGGHFGTGSYWAITKPVSMNWQGNVLFQAYLTPTTPYPPGIHVATQPAVFLWNAAKQQLTTVAGPGTKLGDLTILSASGGDAPAINNNNEMVVNVRGSLSAAPYYFNGLLFIGADGKTLPIAQYGQKLPDGKTTSGGSQPILNDAGVVAFAPAPGAADAYYLWDKATGSIAGPIMAVGQNAGGGLKIASIEEVSLDPLTASGLYQVRLNDPLGPVEVHQFFAFEVQASVQAASAVSARVQALSSVSTVTVTRSGSKIIVDYVVKNEDGGKYRGILTIKTDGYWPLPGSEDIDPLIKQVKEDAGNVANAQDKLNQAKTEGESIVASHELSDAEERLRMDLGNAVQAGSLPGLTGIEPSDLGFLHYCQAPDPVARGRTKRDARARAHPGSGHPSRARKQTGRLCSGATGPFFSLATPNVYLGKAADGSEAAYWIGADRQFKLLIADGMSVPGGTIRQVWVYPLELGNGGWNDYYQVALRANIADAGGGIHDAILLLSPKSAP